MKIEVGTKTIEESNRFLRAFWAELRRTFPRYGWLFSPFKQRNTTLVHIGHLDLGVEEGTFEVTLSYARKGEISYLDFEPDSHQPARRPDPSSIEQSRNLLLSAARKAIDTRQKPNQYTFANKVSSLYMPLSSYQGDRFSTRSLDERRFEIVIDIPGYDEVDAVTNCVQMMGPILDLLSIETNLPFWPLSPPRPSKHHDADSGEEIFQKDEDWIDGIPNVGEIGARRSTISRIGKSCIDRILSAHAHLADVDLFLRGCGHFHAARQQEAYSLELHHAPEVSSYTARVTQIELSVVLYMSSLEVVSSIGSSSSERCPSCNQEIHLISSRVRGILTEHLGLAGTRFANDYYARRSGYLHRGEAASTGAYVGKTIPQLDPDDPSLFQNQLPVPPTNLREFVSYSLRKTLPKVLAV